MIANARMYSVTPEVGTLWRQLMAVVAEQSGLPLDYLEYPAPASLDDLWLRDDLGAVFMCGLPYVRSEPRPAIVAAPVPAPASFRSQPHYWSELVVRADTGFELIEDTFGHRIAFTAPESQSGCQAALYFLMAAGGRDPLYREVVAPTVTPLGAASAVIAGLADVAPIDSFALSLLQQYRPELTAQLRTVARTAPTAIPPLVASKAAPEALEAAFLELHANPSARSLMARLQLDRFVRPELESYEVLKRRFGTTTAFWREHPFAASVDPGFATLARG